MKHCLKYAEENDIIFCDWKMREDIAQPWIALVSSLKPLVSALESHFEQTGEEQVDSNIIKAKLEKKYGFIRPTSWKDILTVAEKYPSIILKQDGQNYTFLKKRNNGQKGVPIEDNTSEISPIDYNTEDELSPTGFNVPHKYNFELEEPTEEEAPEYSFHTDLQNLTQQFQNNIQLYDKLKPEQSDYSTLDYTMKEKAPSTVSLYQRSEPYLMENSANQSMFHTSPFEMIERSDDRIENDEDEDLDNDSFRNRSAIGFRNEERCIIQ